MLPNPGTLVGGKYRILRLIGEGGMGSVYEARHEHLGSSVALKFLHPGLAERPAFVARFLQEARVSAAIKSPHVTQVVDVDQTPEGDAYLVMELLEGESLEKRLERERVLPAFDAVDIALQVLAALEVAHARGVVHRDLKPDNVWLVPSPSGPHVKLLDFGIAKLRSSDEFRQVQTGPGSMMGTPAYMAPEQAISADRVDARADLYSLGVILYEMLSGARPVDSEEAHEIFARLVAGEGRPIATRVPGLSPGLAALVDALVAPDADRRPASAAGVRSDLARFARGSLPALAPTAPAAASERLRPSVPVPDTVPPDDTSAPPYATRSLPVAPPPSRTGTASMLEVGEATHPGNDAPRPLSSPPAPVPGRRGVGIIVSVTVVLTILLAAGVWLLLNPSVFDDTALPPLPGPLPSTPPPIPELRTPVRSLPAPKPGAPRPKAPAAGPRAPAEQQTSAPASTQPSMNLPFPIPSGFSIPTALPTFFPEIPGITPKPTSTAPATAPTSTSITAPTSTAPALPSVPALPPAPTSTAAPPP